VFSAYTVAELTDAFLEGTTLKLLAIDTATEACSAALLHNDIVIKRYQIAPRQHTALILEMIDSLLAEAGLTLREMDALAFGRGPGAFTGVRIAAGVIQGLAYGAELPVIPVSTLAALAQGVAREHKHIISAIDARMGEIYWCIYRSDAAGQVHAVTEEKVGRPEELQTDPDNHYFGAGSGWSSYQSVLQHKLGNQLVGMDGNLFPDAENIIALARRDFLQGKLLSAADALPVYIRNKVTG
jgi:tRNA threonylcarbamoyladenosine biosynthesis protein TsaB